MDMRENHIGIRETGRKYGVYHSVIQNWERIYIEEGAEGLMKERRGRACKERKLENGDRPSWIKGLKKI